MFLVTSMSEVVFLQPITFLARSWVSRFCQDQEKFYRNDSAS